MSKHERLKAVVMSAIEDLFSDTTVTQEKTRESLREIADECEMKILAIQESSDD